MALLPGTSTQHRYQNCEDEDCDRFPCRVYQEGFEAGKADGRAGGYTEGRADGFAEGYDAGQAAGGE